jgi:hypothetical protein
MSTAKANGLNVLVGSIRVPRVGVWVAELELDGDDATKANGVVTIEAGSTSWKGKAVESGAFVGRIKARIFGGAGGLSKATKPRFYASIPAKVIINDLLEEGSEKLSSTSDAGKLGTILPFWTRHAGTVSEGLENLLDEIGAVWRVLPDGTVWVGVETWPTAKVTDVAVESEDPKDSRITFSSESPSLLPGTTFKDRKVSRVEHEISASKTRTTAICEAATGAKTTDPLRSAVDTLVRQATKHVDFYAVRAGKVVSQNTDGTLELKLDDPDMPGMSKIPIAYGIPGVTAKVKAGARVHVEFADGSPTKPRAVVIDSSGLTEVTVKSTKVIVDALESIAMKGGASDLELSAAIATLKGVMTELGTGGTGVATQATLAPFMVSLLAFLTALQAFLNFAGVVAISGGTAAPAAAAAAALGVLSALPTNYSLTVKAGS